MTIGVIAKLEKLNIFVMLLLLVIEIDTCTTILQKLHEAKITFWSGRGVPERIRAMPLFILWIKNIFKNVLPILTKANSQPHRRGSFLRRGRQKVELRCFAATIMHFLKIPERGTHSKCLRLNQLCLFLGKFFQLHHVAHRALKVWIKL